MAQNKNALIRYKTINKCLQNNFKAWTLDGLIDACSQALYEYEGRTVNVSKRTVQLDIQLMRSDKLGYNAPIEVYEKKFYRYSDPNFSITNIPISETDMKVLSETIAILKQFQDFSLFGELKGLFNKLEDKIYTEKTNKFSIIHLDKNEDLKGLEFLDEIYQAVLKEVVLLISYKPFKSKHPSIIVLHPYFLKEFNNRWFVVGKPHAEDRLLTLALDRIVAIDYNFNLKYQPNDINPDDYYKNTIGVTVLDHHNLKHVRLKIDRKNAPYVLTKPFHNSQTVLSENPDGSVVIELFVHINFELERLILGFGEAVEVLSPKQLRRNIFKKLNSALSHYNN
ncbi:WYL domain-containing protein [Formosa sediminum]|uniref:WYL domain-containing protein n=1 Tax=Formosa sediminum TaxID=2594004 RepID=A0A516GUV0_9FLAO|nr:WYL domain-containing protein [Formosa sediminum]QDO95298.1 WYL domain-containing protein [Formosa sediminum]